MTKVATVGCPIRAMKADINSRRCKVVRPTITGPLMLGVVQGRPNQSNGIQMVGAR